MPNSEDDKKVVVEENHKPVEHEVEQVSKKAFTDVSTDMHKYKAELKETKLLLNQMQAEKDAAKNEQLAEQGRWEELYKQSQTNLDAANSGRQEEQDKFINYHKKNSVLNTIGGFKRDEYNNFINVESINLNEDGSIEGDSLTKEIDRIRQTYPELIKTGSAEKLPNNAPAQSNMDRKYNDLSSSEKDDYRRNLLKKPSGY